MAKKPDDCIDLPQWTDEENEWIAAVLAIPSVKPKRAATLFVHRFDHLKELPVDSDLHPDIEGPYYSIGEVVEAVVHKFRIYRRNKETANYKAIQAKKALYSDAFGSLYEILVVFDPLELALMMEEMYLGIKEYDKNKLNLLKYGITLRGSLYKPKADQESSEDSDTPVPGWHVQKAPTSEAHERAKAKTESGNS